MMQTDIDAYHFFSFPPIKRKHVPYQVHTSFDLRCKSVYTTSQHCSVGVGTRIPAGLPRNPGSIPDRGKGIYT